MTHSRLLPLLTVALLVAADLACWHWLAPDRAGLTRGTDLAGLLSAVAAWVLQVGLTWVLLLVTLTAAEPYAGRELASWAMCPPAMRPVLLAVCGIAAVGAFAGPTRVAAPVATTEPPSNVGTVTAHETSPRPADQPPAVQQSTTSARTRPTPYVVAPGDSLWTIAEHRLPRTASDAQVTAAWHRLYARNRARIGPDPDLIAPGTPLVLTPPTHQEDR